MPGSRLWDDEGTARYNMGEVSAFEYLRPRVSSVEWEEAFSAPVILSRSPARGFAVIPGTTHVLSLDLSLDLCLAAYSNFTVHRGCTHVVGKDCS